MQVLKTPLSHEIYLGEGLLFSPHLVEVCATFDRCFLLCDTIVHRLYGQQFESNLRSQGILVQSILLPPGEAHKTREEKARIEDVLLQSSCTRRSLLLALGGGVIMDLVGFVGATFHRGIAVLYLPTTLLGMVDAAIGGKTAVNTSFGKNLIGCFSLPHSVWIDPLVLETLPDKECRSGWGEIAKHALLGDPTLWSQLVANAIDHRRWLPILASSCKFKASIVAEDPYEKGVRAILNLGHTVGHALEQASGYRLSHGACVSVGLWVEAQVGATLGVHRLSLCHEIVTWVQRLFPEEVAEAKGISWVQLHPFLQQDKKGGTVQGRCPLVLLQDVGIPWQEAGKWIFWTPNSEVAAAWAHFLTGDVL